MLEHGPAGGAMPLEDVSGKDERQPFVAAVAAELTVLTAEYAPGTTLDLLFLAYLRVTSRFGFFRYGPVVLDSHVVEEIAARTIPRMGGKSSAGQQVDGDPRFSRLLSEEVRKSGRTRIDELHYLLAFMRIGEGLPGRVFGELGVSADAVERFGRTGTVRGGELEKLFSPEEAAAYLGVHVQTVRAWVRSGRLPASRLTGQRALRIRASDLLSVLEPVDAHDDDDGGLQAGE